MKPLPVLILVLVAIAVTLSVFLFRGAPDPGDVPVAPTPVSKAEQPTPATPEIREPVRQPEKTPVDGDALGDDDPDQQPINNRVIGVVLNDKEQPVAAATVRLSQDPMMGESLANDFFLNRESTGKFFETVTDDKGGYVFKVVEPGRNYYVMAMHPEYAAVQEDSLHVKRIGETRAPDMVMRQGSRIYGTVVDFEGNPLNGAVLELDSAYMMGLEMQSPDRLTTSTNSQGLYEFRNVSEGARNLTCRAEGFECQVNSDGIQPTGLPDYQKEVKFTLGLGLPIAGRVFGPMNEGVKGATVTALNYGAGTSSRGSTVTDEEGNFQLMGLARGSYILMVNAVGYRPAKQTRVQAEDVAVQIEMIQQNTLHGHVLEFGSGKPVENFTVQVLRVNTAIPQQGSQPMNYEPTNVKLKVQRSTDGSYSLPGVDPGLFALKVTSSGYASKITDNFTVVDGQMRAAIDVFLSKGGSIKGRVVDAATGKPVPGVTVYSKDGDVPGDMLDPLFDQMVATRATEVKSRSNADGFFELKKLSAGRYRLQLEHADYTTALVNDVIVTEDKATDAGSIKMLPGGSVNGKVVDGAGKPCARATVRLYNEQTTEALQARTDNEGRFSIEHVKPGMYRMSASRSSGAGGEVFDNIVAQQNSEVQIQVFESQATSRDLTLGN